MMQMQQPSLAQTQMLLMQCSKTQMLMQARASTLQSLLCLLLLLRLLLVVMMDRT
jgi:hypothetical protein